jgi:hypothetical protein
MSVRLNHYAGRCARFNGRVGSRRIAVAVATIKGVVEVPGH